MVTLVLQSIVPFLQLAFAVLALLTAVRLRRFASVQGVAWLITGVAFGMYAANSCIQVVLSIIAFRVGPGHPFFDWYLSYAPSADHSRSALILAFAASVLALSRRRDSGSVDLLPHVAAFIAAMGMGFVLGRAEGPLSAARHFPITAAIDTAGIVILATVLFVVMVKDTVDRLLWSALAVHGLTMMMGILFLAALAWIETASAWTPPIWSLHLLRGVLTLVMVALAARRLRTARMGVPVPGLMPALKRPQPSLV